MRLIAELDTAGPFDGSRKITAALTRRGEEVNRKRVQRLMREMGLEAIDPKPRRSAAGRGQKIDPDLWRGVKMERPDQVWSAEITDVPRPSGFRYLAAVIGWSSRDVLARRRSKTRDGAFCLARLEEALRGGCPEVFHTDPGVQFTAEAFPGRRLSAGVSVSRDGRGRAWDNVFVERLGRTVKYEDIYIRVYETVAE